MRFLIYWINGRIRVEDEMTCPHLSKLLVYIFPRQSKFVLKLNYRKEVFFFLIHLFARDILSMKKMEIGETKAT